MRSYAALLVGVLVLLGGCIGGTGGTATGDAAQGTNTTLPATTDVEENVTATFVVEGEPNVTVTLEVANSPEERQRGLMFRKSLPKNHGMIFVYSEAQPLTFWMKNTLIPLDMIFVAPNGTVLNVEHAETQLNASESELKRYSSEGDAIYVVELPRGFANRTGVGPGTQLVFDGSTPQVESAAPTNTTDGG